MGIDAYRSARADRGHLARATADRRDRARPQRTIPISCSSTSPPPPWWSARWPGCSSAGPRAARSRRLRGLHLPPLERGPQHRRPHHGLSQRAGRRHLHRAERNRGRHADDRPAPRGAVPAAPAVAVRRTPFCAVRRTCRPARTPRRQLQSSGKAKSSGFGGLAGQGHRELFLTLFGAARPAAGHDHGSDGRPSASARRVRPRSRANRLALVPEDRKTEGLLLGMSVRDNLTLSILERLVAPAACCRPSPERRRAEQWSASLACGPPASRPRSARLSGGNQQKVLLGRWLLTDPRILLFYDVTRGVDVATKHEILRTHGPPRGRGPRHPGLFQRRRGTRRTLPPRAGDARWPHRRRTGAARDSPPNRSSLPRFMSAIAA